MKQAILGTALILMTVTGFILGRALVEQEVAHTANCNQINHEAEYTIEELSEAGCFETMDFINNL